MLNFILFADDTNVFYEHHNIDMMCKIVSVELHILSTQRSVFEFASIFV